MDILGFKDKKFMASMVRISIPIVLQQAINTAMYMADTVMIGALGDVPLAGVGAANQLAFLLDIFMFGIASGGGVFMAQYWGKRDVGGIRSALGLSVFLSLVASALFVAAAQAAPMWLVGVFSDEAAVVQSGAKYLRVASIGYLFKAVINPYGTAHRSCTNAKLPMLAGLAGLLVNIFFNYCMIFGHLGFPAMGVEGAAWATIIGSAVSAGWLLIASYAKDTVARASLREMAAQTAAGVREFFRISIPVFLDDAVWALGTLALTWVYGKMGTDTFAAVMITNTVDKLTMVVLISIGTAASVILGNTLGEGDYERAQIYGKRFLFQSLVFGAVIGVLVSTLGTLVPTAYVNTTENVRYLATRMIVVMGLFMPTNALDFTMVVGILRSGGDTRAAAAIDLLPLWLLAVPATVIGGLVLKLPLHYVYLLTLPSCILRAVWGLKRIRVGEWIKNVV